MYRAYYLIRERISLLFLLFFSAHFPLGRYSHFISLFIGPALRISSTTTFLLPTKMCSTCDKFARSSGRNHLYRRRKFIENFRNKRQMKKGIATIRSASSHSVNQEIFYTRKYWQTKYFESWIFTRGPKIVGSVRIDASFEIKESTSLIAWL